MGSSGRVRWGAAGLTFGGAAWLVSGFSNVLGYLQAIPGRENVALLVLLALVLTAAGLAGIHARQKATGSWDERAFTSPLPRSSPAS